MIKEFKVKSLDYSDLVNLFSTATYGNDAIYIDVPFPYRALAEGADCLEGRWANVLLKGGKIDIYDLFDDSDTSEESKLNRYGEKGINWVTTSFRPPHDEDDIYVTAYRISLETLMKGMSTNSAIPYIEELFDEEAGDMWTAYNLLQIAIFGEIIYG